MRRSRGGQLASFIFCSGTQLEAASVVRHTARTDFSINFVIRSKHTASTNAIISALLPGAARLQITRGQSLLHLPLLSPATGCAGAAISPKLLPGICAQTLFDKQSVKSGLWRRDFAVRAPPRWRIKVQQANRQVKRLMWFVWQTWQIRFMAKIYSPLWCKMTFFALSYSQHLDL